MNCLIPFSEASVVSIIVRTVSVFGGCQTPVFGQRVCIFFVDFHFVFDELNHLFLFIEIHTVSKMRKIFIKYKHAMNKIQRFIKRKHAMNKNKDIRLFRKHV